MTRSRNGCGSKYRQQAYQLCTTLAAQRLIERRPVEQGGKRRKIHSFPLRQSGLPQQAPGGGKAWERRLAALEAATGLNRDDVLDRALASYAFQFLKGDVKGD